MLGSEELGLSCRPYHECRVVRGRDPNASLGRWIAQHGVDLTLFGCSIRVRLADRRRE